ncbi:MAG: hypothetical protein ACQCN6_01710 [Candidatus Bathyarchaeia archaeon]|jgi:hypothetical protein
MNPWLMYRVWLPKDAQLDFISKMVDNPPEFAFSFNRYYNMIETGEKDHIQFRFRREDTSLAEAYLVSLGQDTIGSKTLFEWESNAHTIQTALVASKCAVDFMKLNQCRVAPNSITMMEFLHFFFDAIGLTYRQEAFLAKCNLDFWMNWKHFSESWGSDKIRGPNGESDTKSAIPEGTMVRSRPQVVDKTALELIAERKGSA